MRRIIKKSIKGDNRGNIHHHSFQQLTDDETGTIDELVGETYSTCENCLRPLSAPEIRACDCCSKLACDRCTVACSICSRFLCSACRRGFPDKQLTVCPECLRDLIERREYHEKMIQEKICFDRRLSVYREQVQLLKHRSYYLDFLGELIEQFTQLRLARKLKQLERAINHHELRE